MQSITITFLFYFVFFFLLSIYIYYWLICRFSDWTISSLSTWWSFPGRQTTCEHLSSFFPRGLNFLNDAFFNWVLFHSMSWVLHRPFNLIIFGVTFFARKFFALFLGINFSFCFCFFVTPRLILSDTMFHFYMSILLSHKVLHFYFLLKLHFQLLLY